jgi:hypothetical protein
VLLCASTCPYRPINIECFTYRRISAHAGIGGHVEASKYSLNRY